MLKMRRQILVHQMTPVPARPAVNLRPLRQTGKQERSLVSSYYVKVVLQKIIRFYVPFPHLVFLLFQSEGKKDDSKDSTEPQTPWFGSTNNQPAPGLFPMDFHGGLMGFNPTFSGRYDDVVFYATLSFTLTRCMFYY